MKKMTITLLLPLFLLSPLSGRGQDHEIQQLLLNVEKLNSLRDIYADMIKGYQVLYQGYNRVSDLAQGNFSVHDLFITGLSAVSPVVRDYPRAKELIRVQTKTLLAYREAIRDLHSPGFLKYAEIRQLEQLYANINGPMLQLVDELLLIMSPGSLSMSDQQRIQAIDRLHESSLKRFAHIQLLQQQLRELRTFRQQHRRDNTVLDKMLIH